jgi:hypothetical protein
MHHIAKRSYVGEYQWWGLPSATSHAAVKQGWNIAFGHANVNTTGYVNGDRYVVVIMSRGPVRSYLGPITRMVTQTARLLLPDGRFPDPVPNIGWLSTRAAPTRGGRELVLRGTSFTDVTGLLFGGAPAVTFTVVSQHKIVATAPPHQAGRVFVRVVTSHGASPRTPASAFRYVPLPIVSSVRPAVGATSGGNTITVDGTSFVDVRRVVVGGVPAPSVSVHSERRLTAIAPAHATGIVHVRVITAYGRSAHVPADHFLYDDPQPPVSDAAASPDAQSIEVTWRNPANAQFAGVKICRSTDPAPQPETCTAVATVPAPNSGFSDTDITAGTMYYYTLFAVDTFHQESAGVTVWAAA